MVAPRKRELIPYAVLLVSLLLTSAVARYAYVTGLREDQLRFENSADEVIASIVNRLDAYVAMLLGGAGLFAASQDVTREEFRAYVQRLELQRRYPGIQGIGFSMRIRTADRERVLAEVRRQIPSVRFWPQPTGDEFNAIVYLEPDDLRNRLALGYDMGSERHRAEAMALARDSGAPAATVRVRLVQEGDDARPQAGFLIYVPVYGEGSVPATVEQRRRALFGFVYSPFRADDLLQGVVGTKEASAVAFEVFDGPTPDEAKLMHRSGGEVTRRAFDVITTISIAERPWTIRLYGDDPTRGPVSRLLFAFIGVGGVALSFLLFAVIRGQVLARIAADRTAEELRRSEERLRAADRAKDEFLATVSHELRTPLNAIVGWAAMLGRGALPREMYPHAISVIARNASAQARLVEDLLDMSRVVGGHLRLHFTDVDPRSILASVVDSFRPSAEEAGLTLSYEPAADLGTIEADPGRLQQVVSNLLSNAIKFTPRGGRVTLRAERKNGTLGIMVRDTGIGLEPGFVPLMFERFRQADSSSTRAHPGAGLGLAIARHLVELHGGTIEASSAGPGRGATFTVRLPARQDSERSAATSAELQHTQEP